jgi:hypothetical protein
MAEFIFALSMCVAISTAVVTAFGFTYFALVDDVGSIRSTWDWFAVAASVMLIVAILVIAKQTSQFLAL